METTEYIEVRGRYYFQLKSILKRYFSVDVTEIYNLDENKLSYLALTESGGFVKLDVYDINNLKVIRNIEIYKLIPKKIKCPTLIGVMKTPEQIFKATQWIPGTSIKNVWNRAGAFKDAGATMAKLNCIKDPITENYLTFNKFNFDNVIWGNDGHVYFTGNGFSPAKDVDKNIVWILHKMIQKKARIDWFLNGYKRYRDATRIKEILKELEQTNETMTADITEA